MTGHVTERLTSARGAFVVVADCVRWVRGFTEPELAISLLTGELVFGAGSALRTTNGHGPAYPQHRPVIKACEPYAVAADELGEPVRRGEQYIVARRRGGRAVRHRIGHATGGLTTVPLGEAASRNLAGIAPVDVGGQFSRYHPAFAPKLVVPRCGLIAIRE